ncbi:carbamoyltransferase HypF [Actinomadura craniellae]|uniref:Carbamoyltransferase n=1 Tax=Actinomadura craniellae TaxID=2231787 RepID=A0A365H9K9_9ACTN|nr:carbamoyltransferase HypF [Actinomadura craniellae]RAY15688.1 carbamoyltransferase HypF [Actinomadura craniellae]
MSARQRIRVEGIVQGVGFRPFVYGLATRLGVRGSVRNDPGGVLIDAEGDRGALDRLLAGLETGPPALAVVERIQVEDLPPAGLPGFTIVPSGDGGPGRTLISADTATCVACLAEVLDPADRRYRHPFANCTGCGPRFTVVTGVPYDRARTTMVGFALCDDCRHEYADPADRRFHAQPTCCPRCGPRLELTVREPGDLAARSPGAGATGGLAVEAAWPPGVGTARSSGAEVADAPAIGAARPPGAGATGDPATGAARSPGAGVGGDPAAWLPGAGAMADPATGTAPSRGVGVAGDLVAEAARLLAAGAVLAVKGLGGYHLAVDASDETAVAALRARKRRPDKPFALLAANADAVRELCEGVTGALPVLAGRRRPIVLLPRRPAAPVAPSVAPGRRELGVMLPSTPLHHLLARELGRPMVLTSANVASEPIVHLDEEVPRLAGLVDGVLAHDRPIHARADDSVVRIFRGRELPVRRSRGYAPEPVPLPVPAARPVLACGGELKNTFCLARGRRAFLSPHVGDLADHATYRAFTEGIEHFRLLFGIRPEVVAHDLHPGYPSTGYALELDGVETVGVQHHHAHIASCLADNGAAGPVLGVAFDGTGHGLDGTVWGGEFLVADLAGFERVAHLEPVRLPGGDAAVREPWRMAAAYLLAACGANAPDLPVAVRHGERWRLVTLLARRGTRAPWTSSAGRLFDAVAAVLDLRDTVTYEGQAAIDLEQCADPAEPGAYPAEVAEGDPLVVRGTDLFRAAVDDLLAGATAGVIAARFHRGLADAIARTVEILRDRTGLATVALSGGVFQNVLLLGLTVERLERRGLRVLTHTRVPPGDGGLSLGQAAVAAARCGRG